MKTIKEFASAGGKARWKGKTKKEIKEWSSKMKLAKAKRKAFLESLEKRFS